MSIQKVDHIAIAVRDLGAGIHYYRDVLGLPFHGVETIESLHVEVAFFSCGGAEIELVHGTAPEAAVCRFIEEKGEGLYHIAFEVDDVQKTLDGYMAQGVLARDKAPKPGARGTTVAFLRAESTGGVMTELVQKP